MSKIPSGSLTSIPATSSSGLSKIDYEQLSALFSKSASDIESDLWAPYVVEALRKPQLGGVSFEFTYHDEPSEDWQWDSLWTNEKQPSWETFAKLLMLCLQQASKCWLHPKSPAGHPVLVEHHSGTVNRIAGECVSVRFGTNDEQFEAEYRLGHFQSPQAISRGDRIEAVIGLWHQKHQASGIDRFLTPEEQQKLDADWESDTNMVRGDLDL